MRAGGVIVQTDGKRVARIRFTGLCLLFSSLGFTSCLKSCVLAHCSSNKISVPSLGEQLISTAKVEATINITSSVQSLYRTFDVNQNRHQTRRDPEFRVTAHVPPLLATHHLVRLYPPELPAFPFAPTSMDTHELFHTLIAFDVEEKV